MQNIGLQLLAAIVGYLIGSISFARIVFSRLKPGEEPDRIRTPTKDGQAELVSHSIGATNVMIAFGKRWGVLTTALDVAKAFIPTLLIHLAFPNESYHLVCAVAILLGHLWPIWYKFSGGGGNSCIIGMLLAISPIGFLVTHATGMLIGNLLPMFSFLAGVVMMIPWFIWRDGLFSAEMVFAVFITLLYVAGQLPEAMKVRELKRAGHQLDVSHVMRLMKRSAVKVRPGSQFSSLDQPVLEQSKNQQEIEDCCDGTDNE